MPDPDAPARPPAPDRVTVLEHVQRWRGDPRVALVAVALAVLAGIVVWMRTADDASLPPAVAGTATTDPAGGTTSTTAAVGPVVHVVGAVRSAGVVQLPVGARVRDAVVAAGGAADGADLERLNLAAPVSDGQRVAVPRIGEAMPPALGAEAGTEPSDASGGGEPSDVGPLNLNTATVTDLETLPGIGPTLAEAIVREREKLGGFDAVEDLKQVRGIGDARFADIRDLVTV